MATVEWASTKMHYGEGRKDEPWACIEYYPKLKPAGYYWWAHRPGMETVDGWTATLEDAQRLCEDVMFGETTDGTAEGRKQLRGTADDGYAHAYSCGTASEER